MLETQQKELHPELYTLGMTQQHFQVQGLLPLSKAVTQLREYKKRLVELKLQGEGEW